MSRNSKVMNAILSLHRRMLAAERDCSNPEAVRQITDFMAELKGVGLIEGLEISGTRGRYFLIDGNSWVRACRKLKASVVPNFVIWEEADFFGYLDSLLTVLVKSKAKNTSDGFEEVASRTKTASDFVYREANNGRRNRNTRRGYRHRETRPAEHARN